MPAGGHDLGVTTGAPDQGRRVLGAGEHIVVRGGDGGTSQEAQDLLQVPIEVGLDPLPRPGPGWGICGPTGLHLTRPSSGRRKPAAGTDPDIPYPRTVPSLEP